MIKGEDFKSLVNPSSHTWLMGGGGGGKDHY